MGAKDVGTVGQDEGQCWGPLSMELRAQLPRAKDSTDDKSGDRNTMKWEEQRLGSRPGGAHIELQHSLSSSFKLWISGSCRTNLGLRTALWVSEIAPANFCHISVNNGHCCL